MTAPRDYSVEAQGAAEDIANAVQILSGAESLVIHGDRIWELGDRDMETLLRLLDSALTKLRARRTEGP